MPFGPPRRPDVTLEAFLKQQYHLDICQTKPFLAVVPDGNPGVKEWDRTKGTAEMRTALINLNVPFYTNIGRAAIAAKKVIDYYRHLERHD